MSKESFGGVRNSAVASQPYPSGYITSGYLASLRFAQILRYRPGLQIPLPLSEMLCLRKTKRMGDKTLRVKGI